MEVEGPGNPRAGNSSSALAATFPSGSAPGGPEQMSAATNYTIPGILHFIKHEWSRFEKEKAMWEVERAELQAKIAFLQGERKGHETLMHDLVRRIKMLEFALKGERAKLYKLQHPGKELVFSDMKPPVSETEQQGQMDMSTVTQQKEESRKILREYLREVGFPDTVLEARLSRIAAYKSLYAQNHSTTPEDSIRIESPKVAVPTTPSFPAGSSLPNGPIANGTDMQVQGSTNVHVGSAVSGGSPVSSIQSPDEFEVEAKMPQENRGDGGEEETVLNSFGFLDDEDSDEDENEDEDEDEGVYPQDTTSDDSSGVEIDINSTEKVSLDEFEFSKEVNRYTQNKQKKTNRTRPGRSELKRMEQYINQAEDQSSPPSSTNQQPSSPSSSSSSSQPFGSLGIMRLPGRGSRRADTRLVPGVGDETIEASLLGDLAVLSISNDSHENPVESMKKWDNKYTMRSHFDAVTSVAFHPSDHVLVTGSEDCTVKVWNLQKANQSRRSAIVDVEPLHTFRGHSGSVLSVAVSLNGELCFSGSADSTIGVWQLPGDLSDPFDVYDPQLNVGELKGHMDAIWDLAIHATTGLLLSCASDGTCRLWNHQLTNPQLKLYQAESRFGNPTSIDFVATDLHQMVASYTTARTVLFDIETGQAVLNLDSAATYDGTPNTQINKIACHPTLPIVVSAHEDKYIRMYDINTGKVTHSMTAHLDSVTSLAIDPHGLYLLSGGHDGSLRFWSMDSKMCIQELTAHRKRYDESIYNVACHLSKPYFASAGADGIAKVFV